MAKRKDKKSGQTGGDVLIAVLIALAGSLAFFAVVLVAGSLMFPETWEQQTAEQPPVQSFYRGTLPSRAPAPAPTPPPANGSDPERTAEPDQNSPAPTATPPQAPAAAQTQPPAQTGSPAATPSSPPAATPSKAPAQNPGPIVSISPTVPPVRQTQPPAQSGGSGSTNSGGRIIYITPTGRRYHYDNHCNGGTYIESTLEEALSRNLTPCNRCVQ